MSHNEKPADFIPQPPQFTQQQLAEAYFAQKDDEIDLRELFMALWKGKWIIIAMTFIFAVGAVAYALTAQEWWTAKAKITTPRSNDIMQLSQQAAQYEPVLGDVITGFVHSNALFGRFISEFNATNNKKDFFDNNESINAFLAEQMTGDEDSDQAQKRRLYEEWYSKVFALAHKDLEGGYQVSLQSITQSGSAVLLEEYMQYIANIVHDELFENINTTIDNKRKALIAQKQVLETRVKDKLDAELVRSEYAYKIAQAASLNKPLENLNSDGMFAINLGADALGEKVKVLAGVKDLGAIEPKLTQIDTTLALIDKIDIDASVKYTPYRFLKDVELPIGRDKPKRALIAVLGTLLGGMLGVAVVLVGFAFRKGDEAERAAV